MKNIPFISYIRRYWILLIVFAVALVAAMSHLFDIIGTLVYLPVLAVGAVLVSLLIRHLFFSQTLDADVHSGDFVKWWQTMEPCSRVVLNLAAMGILFLGVCYIAAALIK